jgi:hypothetical protein
VPDLSADPIVAHLTTSQCLNKAIERERKSNAGAIDAAHKHSQINVISKKVACVIQVCSMSCFFSTKNFQELQRMNLTICETLTNDEIATLLGDSLNDNDFYALTVPTTAVYSECACASAHVFIRRRTCALLDIACHAHGQIGGESICATVSTPHTLLYTTPFCHRRRRRRRTATTVE